MAVGDPYLNEAEYSAYGLPDDTDPVIVADACRLVNEYTHRTTSAVEGVANGLWAGPYKELRRLPEQQIVRLNYRPPTSITALRGRFRPSRRNFQMSMYPDDTVLLLNGMGTTGIPNWITLDPTQAQIDADGRMWVPRHLTGVPWTEVEVEYIAGYAVIPENAKQAVASLVNEVMADGVVKKSRMKDVTQGDTRVVFFEPGYLTAEIKSLLNPYRLRSYA